MIICAYGTRIWLRNQNAPSLHVIVLQIQEVVTIPVNNYYTKLFSAILKINIIICFTIIITLYN